MNTISYTSERDRAYGITGMAVTVVALENGAILDSIDLDAAEASECLRLAPHFEMRINPRMSAKVLWEQTLSDLSLSVSMALGNLYCRRYVLDRRAPSATETETIRQALGLDAGSHLELDADEIDALFAKCSAYAQRLFRHSGVVELSHSFASRLLDRRRFTGTEAVELLAQLGLR